MRGGGQQDSSENTSVVSKLRFQDLLKGRYRDTFSRPVIKGVLLVAGCSKCVRLDNLTMVLFLNNVFPQCVGSSR